MKKYICLISCLMAVQSGFAASPDLPNLPLAIQEEFSFLWFHEMLYQSNQLKSMNTVEEWDQYKECIDSFESVFESATINEDAEAIIGYVVYGNCCEFWEKIIVQELISMVEDSKDQNLSKEKHIENIRRKAKEANADIVRVKKIGAANEKYNRKLEIYKERAIKLGLSKILKIQD